MEIFSISMVLVVSLVVGIYLFNKYKYNYTEEIIEQFEIINEKGDKIRGVKYVIKRTYSNGKSEIIFKEFRG